MSRVLLRSICRRFRKQEGPNPRPMIDNPPPLNRDYNRDPSIKALKRRGFINHGSPLV